MGDMGLWKLARVQLTKADGQIITVRAGDIARAEKHGEFTVVTMDVGQPVISSSTPATIHTAIDTLWDEFTAALGDPA